MNEAGKQAKENFDKALQLVKEGKYEEARAVELLESDRRIIERRIGANDNTANLQEGK